MNITNRGKKWERRNSLWIIWSFTLVLGCVGFFWIGAKTGKRKWIITGLIYLILNFGLIYVAIWLETINQVAYNISFAVVFISWFAVIVHSFMVRKEYLIRREAVLDLTEATRDAYRDELRKDYFSDTNSKPLSQSQQNITPPQPVQQNQVPVGVQSPQTTQPQSGGIDLNTCSEEQLATLPGVGVALAKRAIALRSESGAFVSVDDFCSRLNLMPHFTVQINDLAHVSSASNTDSPPENVGRVIDI